MRALLLAFVLLPAAAAAAAQAPAPQPPPAGQPPQGQPAPAPAQRPAPPPAVTLEPQGFDYDPGGRRDPFVSLLRRGADAQRSAAGARPAGLAGLETAEVTLKGTLQNRDGYLAMVQGADGRTYIVRPGDRLLDGVVRSISQNALVILQQVNDPLAPEKQREVRKTIRQTDEAK